MKRLISLLLLLALVVSLAACADENAVTYYYVRDEEEYLYGAADGVMVGERRSAAGHVDDLRYLLILYFHGPVTDYLKSPFPSGTNLEELVQQEDSLDIRLSGIVSMMEGADLTLACACLARTCFGMTDVQSITIHAESLNTVSITFTRDSLLLVDESAQNMTQAAD
ncbi:MAG: hypothetical protein IJZ39_11020 [Oscillospiraceae bacterium]|nr:hypothetical protein [Oscillospiraceae bacterium]